MSNPELSIMERLTQRKSEKHVLLWKINFDIVIFNSTQALFSNSVFSARMGASCSHKPVFLVYVWA